MQRSLFRATMIEKKWTCHISTDQDQSDLEKYGKVRSKVPSTLKATDSETTLTASQVISLWSSNFHYCDDKAFGIDCSDPYHNYDWLNSLPCCFECNLFKGYMSEASFILLMKSISDHSANRLREHETQTLPTRIFQGHLHQHVRLDDLIDSLIYDLHSCALFDSLSSYHKLISLALILLSTADHQLIRSMHGMCFRSCIFLVEIR